MYDVMVYSESFRTWAPSVEYAARLAAAFDAHLTGVCVCPSPSIGLSSYDAPNISRDLFDATLQLEDEAFAAGPSFVAFADQLGAKKAAWQVAEGDVPPALELIGNWHDLLILGRTSDTPWGSPASVGNIVLGAGMPCLVVPPGGTKLVALDCIVLAWNGSSEALRAIHSALPLLARARRVVILRGEQHPPLIMARWQPYFDLAGYLLRHGIQAESLFLSNNDAEIGTILLEAATQVDADIFVMGGYGHTRFSEWVLGGATRHVLNNATIPVLMRH